jgi:hypothetical protein
MDDAKKESLCEAVESAINCHSRENESNTPDFLLAEFLMRYLEQEA